ncbi:TatD family deoxyribonuclease [Mycoplasmopsis phocirhinis]|uniref:TatD family deoxyribonuclease n=1 Tax=Mycoplasmopsis phocirhinis TaxID=142650 RepID=A0A4P6MMM1_9BACT|nr:TatD family hydrolase [Mycoplasmopsis phocirhinis]QBF34885.1 TatD family deoxyribonuclease [Mycoplasmopsis phocirhinis]
MAIKLVDAHTHPLKEYYSNIDETISQAHQNGVNIMMVTGCSIQENEEVKKICQNYPFAYPVIGIHPNNATGKVDGDLIEAQIDTNIKAIGEIGLDFYWNNVSPQIQIDSLHSQIRVAQKHNLPVVIHMRDSYETLYEILSQYRDVKFMIHTFSGDLFWAKKFYELNTYFSFSGTITYKSSNHLIEVVEWLPIERILTETDAPYLSPAQKRGEQNVMENVIFVATYIAGIKKMSIEKFAKQIYRNAKEFFNINAKK